MERAIVNTVAPDSLEYVEFFAQFRCHSVQFEVRINKETSKHVVKYDMHGVLYL
jgi:hypothetical protein